MQLLAGTHTVANNTSSIPHPYEYGTAEEWIATHQASYEKGEALTFAVGLKENTALIVAVVLMITQHHLRAERDCWIGETYWEQGYCSEAAVPGWGLFRRVERICW